MSTSRFEAYDIPYYSDYLSGALRAHLSQLARQVDGVPHLCEIEPTTPSDDCRGVETKESLQFMCDLYELVRDELASVLKQRSLDRQFIDKRTKSFAHFNRSYYREFACSDYKTILGCRDSSCRVVIGPTRDSYCKGSEDKNVGSVRVPDFLKGDHVTLFGPAYSARFAINAMNCFHRELASEPAIIGELLQTRDSSLPKWGADSEDSCTPRRTLLAASALNLKRCFDANITYHNAHTGKDYTLASDHLAVPIKRLVGLAVPALFLFYKGSPLPLHVYDFALHLYANWRNPSALVFYVPKLENEEEARYIRFMVAQAEYLVKRMHGEYVVGTVRLMVVVENPRAIFRLNEIMDELGPYFVGASLGWHDFLASTARVFKEDPNYRIPVKADPHIVIKYIKASHDLLARVVGSRGGIKVGGMYGVLPVDTDLKSDSFQVTLKGSHLAINIFKYIIDSFSKKFQSEIFSFSQISMNLRN